MSASPTDALSVSFVDHIPLIRCPDHLDFEALRTAIRTALPDHVEDISGRASRLHLGQRRLEHLEVRRLIHLLKEEFGINITAIFSELQEVTRFAERELKLKVFVVNEVDETLDDSTADDIPSEQEDDIVQAESQREQDKADEPDKNGVQGIPDDLGAPEIAEAHVVLAGDVADEVLEEETLSDSPEEPPGNRTLVVRRTVRGGSCIRFDGDVIVYGDVNPDSEVIATGNITVLGALKGIAHGGAGGDEESFILALQFQPSQVRIGAKIAITPSQRASAGAPELARVIHEQITIKPFRGRIV